MARKLSKVKKVRDLKQVIKYTADVFQKLRVLQCCLETTGNINECKCFTCGTTIQRNRKLHGGHWKKRQHHNTLFEKTNCHAQCYTCNRDLHGNMKVYENKIVEKYGEQERDRLIILAKQVKHWTFEELDKMRAKWRGEIKIIIALGNR